MEINFGEAVECTKEVFENTLEIYNSEAFHVERAKDWGIDIDSIKSELGLDDFSFDVFSSRPYIKFVAKKGEVYYKVIDTCTNLQEGGYQDKIKESLSINLKTP